MKEIDYSSKHDIQILNLDGTFSPMDYPFYQAKYIGDGVWQVLSDGDYIYLVEGDNEALAIDCGYGAGNIREFLQGLTKKPLHNVVNTHDHFDHTACNCYFDCAYMSEYTKEHATIPFGSADFAGMEFPRDYPIKVISEGYIFDLGNRTLETFSIPDHSEGSLAFLDRKGRNLFSGDELVSRFKILNGSVERFAKEMEKLIPYRPFFDRICAGNMMCDASYVERYLANAEYILAGNVGEPVTEMPEPEYTDFDESDGVLRFDRQLPRRTKAERMAHKQDPSHMRSMVYDNCKIIYDERKVFEKE